MADPAGHILVLALVTTAAGVVMMRLGLFHNMLEPRRGTRRCPSCGRLLRARVCSKCAGPD